MKNFLKIFKLKQKKQSIKTESLINPHKHWILILWVFLFAVILLIAFSLYLLYEIKNDQVFKIVPAKKDGGVTLKEDLLNKVNKSFEKKAEKELDTKSNPPSFQDPSL